MPTGDPYCSVHGYTPCRCAMYPALNPVCVPCYPTMTMTIANQTAFPMCETCNKMQGACLCSGSSDPWKDIMNKKVYVDLTQPAEEEKPVKKWANVLKEIATEAAKNENEVEGKSAYYFFLERAKIAAKKGQFRLLFWMSKLPWTRRELDVAAELLRDDNFVVTIQVANDLRDSDTEIVVGWQ